MKKSIFPIALILLSVLIFWFANTGHVFGKFIHQYFPCEQNPANSMPCFGKWDIVVMSVMAVLFVVALVWMFKIIKK